MTEYGAPFDGVLVGDASVAPYSAAEWSRIWKLLHNGGGIFPNYGVLASSGGGTYGALEVRQTSVASSNVEVQVGAAQVDGRFYENTAAVSLAIGANASGNPRIDTVILRLDYIGQTIRLAVKQGTPAGSPARPSLQQDATYWEIPLADIAVANGFTTLAQTVISDRRRALFSSAKGWQPTAHPHNYIPGGNYDAASVTFASAAAAKVIPFLLTSNMLLQDVYFRHITNVVGAYTMNWGLYFQDVNDGNTAENTLRLVAQGSASGSTGGTTNVSLPATPAPLVLFPGMYWLALAVPTGSGGAGIAIGAITPGSFDTNGLGHLQNVTMTSGVITQTLNLVSTGTVSDALLAVRLRGRVFGKTSVL